MKIKLFFLGFLAMLLLVGGISWIFSNQAAIQPQKHTYFAPPIRNSFSFESIDTMKYSRDPSREKLNDTRFDQVIEKQVGAIAATGATHVAIATPYDEEFLPIMKRWVEAARKHNLKVWFRGNWSGWEGWFEYPAITREEHIEKTRQFIMKHPELFQDGDAFSACPECENGGPGDPRRTGDVSGHRQFLIAEYEGMQASFREIHKNVRTDLFSMNGDVAKLIMDKATTKALGGIVTIDHYVKTPEQLVKDINLLAEQSGGKIVLGEFGAPIPDIHGHMNQKEQADWIEKLLSLLAKNSSIEGLNYWVGTGGSTEIWNSGGEPRQAVETITKYYHPEVMYGTVTDEQGMPLENVLVDFGTDMESVRTSKDGRFFKVFTPTAPPRVTFSMKGYEIEEITDISKDQRELDIVLVPKESGGWEHFLQSIWKDR